MLKSAGRAVQRAVTPQAATEHQDGARTKAPWRIGAATQPREQVRSGSPTCPTCPSGLGVGRAVSAACHRFHDCPGVVMIKC